MPFIGRGVCVADAYLLSSMSFDATILAANAGPTDTPNPEGVTRPEALKRQPLACRCLRPAGVLGSTAGLDHPDVVDAEPPNRAATGPNPGPGNHPIALARLAR